MVKTKKPYIHKKLLKALCFKELKLVAGVGFEPNHKMNVLPLFMFHN